MVERHTPYSVDSLILFDPSHCSFSTLVSPQYTFSIITLDTLSLQLDKTVDKLLNHLTNPQHKQSLRHILQRHQKIFDTSIPTQANTPIQHTINTGDNPPIISRPYPRTPQQRYELQAEIHKMLQINQIRPPHSPWSSPVIIHKKQDGSIPGQKI